MTESRNHVITDRLKTVYPPKTSFCGGGIKMAMLKNAVNLSKIIFSSL